MRVTFPDLNGLPAPSPAPHRARLILAAHCGLHHAGHAPLLPSLLLLAPIKVP